MPRTPLLTFLLAIAVGAAGVYATTPRAAAVEGAEPARAGTSAPTGGRQATGDGMNDFGACNEDGRRLCPMYFTDGINGLAPAKDWQARAQAAGYATGSPKLSLVDCLARHEDQVSQACSDARARRSSLNHAVNDTCAMDRRKWCQGVVPKPGSEPQIDCLKANREKLSVACVAAVDAHEAAKPR